MNCWASRTEDEILDARPSSMMSEVPHVSRRLVGSRHLLRMISTGVIQASLLKPDNLALMKSMRRAVIRSMISDIKQTEHVAPIMHTDRNYERPETGRGMQMALMLFDRS